MMAFAFASYDLDKQFVDHSSRFIFRIMVTLILAFIGADTIWIYFSNAMLVGSGFYLCFDYMLNILEKRDWNYIGTTAKTDQLYHKWFGETAWIYQLSLKSFLVVLAYIIKHLI